MIGISTGIHDTAHRVSYRLEHGEIPKGFYICHRCDNKKCCNPHHLFLGLPKANVTDMWEKGRQQDYSKNLRGSSLPQSKTTEEFVLKAKQMLTAGSRRADVARQCGLSIYQVHHIARGKTWKHV